jgi:hypothetical protein
VSHDEPVFAVGILAQRAEHRSTDIAGRPVDPRTEGDTARAERIWQLQDRWQPHAFPSADPVTVMQEWMARDPANRMSAFAMKLAEDPSLMPVAEVEPHPGERPQPGGLIEKLAAQDGQRKALAARNLNR